MKSTREGFGLALMCLSLIAAAVWGIVEAFKTRIELNIDGILLIGVGLLVGGLFFLMLLVMAREQGWLPARRKKEEMATAPAASTAPKEAAPAPPKAAAPAPAQSKSPAQEAR